MEFYVRDVAPLCERMLTISVLVCGKVSEYFNASFLDIMKRISR